MIPTKSTVNTTKPANQLPASAALGSAARDKKYTAMPSHAAIETTPTVWPMNPFNTRAASLVLFEQIPTASGQLQEARRLLYYPLAPCVRARELPSQAHFLLQTG